MHKTNLTSCIVIQPKDPSRPILPLPTPSWTQLLDDVGWWSPSLACISIPRSLAAAGPASVSTPFLPFLFPLLERVPRGRELCPLFHGFRVTGLKGGSYSWAQAVNMPTLFIWGSFKPLRVSWANVGSLHTSLFPYRSHNPPATHHFPLNHFTAKSVNWQHSIAWGQVCYLHGPSQIPEVKGGKAPVCWNLTYMPEWRLFVLFPRTSTAAWLAHWSFVGGPTWKCSIPQRNRNSPFCF